MIGLYFPKDYKEDLEIVVGRLVIETRSNEESGKSPVTTPYWTLIIVEEAAVSASSGDKLGSGWTSRADAEVFDVIRICHPTSRHID